MTGFLDSLIALNLKIPFCPLFGLSKGLYLPIPDLDIPFGIIILCFKSSEILSKYHLNPVFGSPGKYIINSPNPIFEISVFE